MYHLLLVDDEDLTVKRLQSAIDWAGLGISQVFTAFSMQQAQKLFAREHIDVMVCDIEMPAGSGIELLHWVRESGYGTINIFLTGHADFSYAKDALALQTLEYILKPVSFEEVERVVRKAVLQLKAQQEERKNREDHFFRQLVHGEIMPNPDSALRAARKLGLDYPSGFSCLPVLVASKSEFKKKETDKTWDARPAILNIVTETCKDLACRPLDYSRHLLLLFSGPFSEEKAAEVCQGALDAVNCTLSVNLLFCVGIEAPLDKLQNSAADLLRAEREIVLDNGIFLPGSAGASRHTKAYAKPNFPLWRTLLEQGNPEGVSAHVRAYLDASPQIDREALYRFYDAYWQMVCSLMNARGIPAQALETVYPEDVTHSLARLVEWVETTNRTLSHCLRKGETGDVVGRAKAYIQEHARGPLGRNQVAESVHLSPEYLSRIFRKETGQSLIEYITDVKMETARELLVHSDLPISQIAAQLGYGNFAYFSQLFRSSAQLSPSDYRRQNRNEGRPS